MGGIRAVNGRRFLADLCRLNPPSGRPSTLKLVGALRRAAAGCTGAARWSHDFARYQGIQPFAIARPYQHAVAGKASTALEDQGVLTVPQQVEAIIQ
jgi:hypothetical protein